MGATRLDWAAAHLGLDGEDKDVLRVILKSVWDEGKEAMALATLPGADPLRNPYEAP